MPGRVSHFTGGMSMSSVLIGEGKTKIVKTNPIPTGCQPSSERSLT
jgi:hypothetical protein